MLSAINSHIGTHVKQPLFVFPSSPFVSSVVSASPFADRPAPEGLATILCYWGWGFSSFIGVRLYQVLAVTAWPASVLH